MTDVLTHDEYQRLVEDEYGDTLPRPLLIQSFDIEETFEENFDWENPKKQAVKVLVLNVAEPRMYTDKKGQVMVIVPHEPFTYALINSFFPVKNAWLYTLSDTVGADLEDRYYYHRFGKNEWDGNIPIPAYSSEDITTH